jgi:hypothetical protein
MKLPGFTAKISTALANRNEFGATYIYNNTSIDITQSASSCSRNIPFSLWYSCNKGCRKVDPSQGEDYMFCMCRCAPNYCCNFP